MDTPYELNDQQRYFFNEVMGALQRREARMFFVEGPAGTGKTYLLNALEKQARQTGYKCVAVASTGVAASAIGGVTAHSLFMLGNSDEAGGYSEPEVDRESDERKTFLADLSLLLWDEVPTTTKATLETVEASLRHRASNKDPFGGKVVVFSGDMMGFLPPSGSLKSAFYWILWPRVEKFTLTINQRFEDEHFAEHIRQIGGIDHTDIDSDMFVDTYEDLFAATFSECLDEQNPEDTFGRAILTLDNSESLRLCDRLLEQLLPGRNVYEVNGSTHLGYLNPSFDEDEHHMLAMASTPNGWPPHTLRLKIGADIILLVNVDKGIEGRRRNGTILTIDDIGNEELICTIRNGQYAGEKVPIPKYHFSGGDKTRLQYPVRLAYARTVHKAQGQNLNKVGFYLEGRPFTYGQFYTAVSRVKSKADIKIFWPGKSYCIDNSKVRFDNFVAKEAFQAAKAGSQLVPVAN